MAALLVLLLMVVVPVQREITAHLVFLAQSILAVALVEPRAVGGLIVVEQADQVSSS